MEIDLAKAGAVLLPQPSQLSAQICIVGGGLVGLVLAHQLALGGCDVLLLEAGGTQPETGPGMDEVELAGEPHLGSREGRPRALGGSSLVWGGQLLPLPDDAGWPVSPQVLQPFLRAAEALLGVDGLPYDAKDFFRALRKPAPPHLGHSPSQLAARISKAAAFPNRNLAASLGRALRRHPRVRVVLRARVTEIKLAEDGTRVTGVEVAGALGQQLLVAAETVVLAAGTVETCRLLLASCTQVPAGVGNDRDQVGRFFHDHLTTEVAAFAGEDRRRAVALFRPWLVGGLRGTMHALKLEAGAALRRELGLTHALAHFVFEEPPGSGLDALRGMLRGRQRGQAASLPLHALPSALRQGFALRQEARGAGRRHISDDARVSLRVNVAQGPTGGSRLRLSDQKDRDGRPVARVEWHHGPEELHTLRTFANWLRTHSPLRDFTALHWSPFVLPAGPAADAPGQPVAKLEDARHAMGGAVMGTDPARSVVDPDLQVHGVAGLYLASAAVFPDGSPQLPSLTLLALTLRLADVLLRRARP